MKLKITKDKVLAAAETCPTAKETLKTLFPEVFEEEKYFSLNIEYPEILPGDHPLCGEIQVRVSGEYEGRGFYLSDDVNWEIVIDNEDIKVLIPTKK